jgi:hypothetical protein
MWGLRRLAINADDNMLDAAPQLRPAVRAGGRTNARPVDADRRLAGS